MLGNTETQAMHYLILMGLNICSGTLLYISNHETRTEITLNISYCLLKAFFFFKELVCMCERGGESERNERQGASICRINLRLQCTERLALALYVARALGPLIGTCVEESRLG